MYVFRYIFTGTYCALCNHDCSTLAVVFGFALASIFPLTIK